MTAQPSRLPQPVERWQAWRLGERQSHPLEVEAAETLDEALRLAMSAAFDPKDTLAVQHSHDGLGKHTLWLFTVKRSTKRGTWRAAYDGGRKVFVGAMEPHLIAQTSLAVAFQPVEPFDAFKDCPVGRDLTLVEAR